MNICFVGCRWFAAVALSVWGACRAAGGTDPQASSFSISPEPAWVRPVVWTNVPAKAETPGDAIRDGVKHLVMDSQTRVGETNSSYVHFVRRFVTETGVSDQSVVCVKFDPSNQSLRFHRLRLWRGTNVTDCLRPDVFRTLQREENLEWRMLDGRLSVVTHPEDIRVGDALEVAYTIEGDNPVFAGRVAGSFLLGWSLEVVCLRVRVIAPDKRPIQWRQYASAPAPVVTGQGAWREWLWDLNGTKPVQIDSTLPSWFRPLPEVAFSEYEAWADVAQWALALYPEQPAPAAVASLLEAWRQAATDDERICAALTFVQDEVRYLGLELGAGSHRPSPPDVVLQRRFGDCKDKAFLLCTLLRAMGYEAAPALVHSGLRQAITNELPSPNAFNHVIVRVRLGDETEWVDPTASHQRGRLACRSLPPYGQALVVAPGTTGFSKVARPRAQPSQTEIVERYRMPDFSQPAALDVRSVFTGRDAERIRARLSDAPRQTIEKEYLNYYAQRYPGVEATTNVMIFDQVESNTLVVVEQYRIRNIWKPDGQDDAGRIACSFRASDIDAYVQMPGTVIRTMPLGLPFPVDVRQKMEVRLPEAWKIESGQVKRISDGLRFDSLVSYTNGLLTLDYRVRFLADAVPADRISDHIATVQRIKDELSYSVSCLRPDRRLKHVALSGSNAFNWGLAWETFMAIILLAVGTVALYRYRPSARPVPPTGPSGLGGWLVLVIIGLFARVILRAKVLVELDYCFNQAKWEVLTRPGSETYHAMWSPLLLAEYFGNLLFLVFALLLIVFFFQRRAVFPQMMIICLACEQLFLVIDQLMGSGIPAVVAQAKNAASQEVAKGLVSICIWIPYLCVSQRVKRTFTQWTKTALPPPLPLTDDSPSAAPSICA